MAMQNAASGGPAVFMFTEAVLRPLRWADDSWATASKFKIRDTCLYMDQDGYADVLPDMVSGFMLFPKAWQCIDEVRPFAFLTQMIASKNTLTAVQRYQIRPCIHVHTGSQRVATLLCLLCLLCSYQLMESFANADKRRGWMYDAQIC